MRCCVTGGAGFIGSTLVDRLLALGHSVTILDNFSTGRSRFLARAQEMAGFACIRGDIGDESALRQAFRGADVVFHLAANADVRHGPERPRYDLEQNTIGTANVLAAAKDADVAHVVFTSSGAVYGDAKRIPTSEDAPFPQQTSLYGASKLAAEGLLTAYAAAFGIKVTILRLVSVLGPRYMHGHVYDFCRSLRCDPQFLTVLGNGHQRKSYIHVDDCVAGIICATANPDRIGIYNLGTDETCDVTQSIGWICGRLGVEPRLQFGTTEGGWVGDAPHIHLDSSRLLALGWRPERSIRDGVEATVDFLTENADWVFRSGDLEG